MQLIGLVKKAETKTTKVNRQQRSRKINKKITKKMFSIPNLSEKHH